MSNDCVKIERLLWQYPDGDISREDKSLVESHLATCQECRAALETISLLKASSAETNETARSINEVAFDAAVMRKIEAQKNPVEIPVAPSRQYVLRTALSFAAAAVIVLFLVKSISDLSNMNIPYEAMKGRSPDTTTSHRVLNIELGRSADRGMSKDITGSEQTPSAPAEAKKPLTITQAPPPNITASKAELPPPPKPDSVAILKGASKTVATAPSMAEEPSASDREKQTANEIRRHAEQDTLKDLVSAESALKDAREGRVLMQAPAAFQRSQSNYSILQKPLTQSAPDSISIESIFLTGTNIPLNVQSSAASLAEVFTDTGAVQAAMPQSSVLVTIKKMPEIVRLVLPDYPIWAKKQGLSGDVWIRAKINENGDIKEAEVLSSTNKGVGFEDAALNAAYASKFRPAEIGNGKISVWIIYPVKFVFKK